MKTLMYDIAIVGSGPIGASTAFYLRNSGKKIAIISPEPLVSDEAHIITYKYAGGSVRWFFDDPETAENTRKTAEFIRTLVTAKIDLSFIEDNYIFLNRGISVPSYNISGPKLITYLLRQSVDSGNVEHLNTMVENYRKAEDGYILMTNLGEIEAKKVLFATGPELQKMFPEANYTFEKRETLILDLVIDENRSRLPHVVVPFHGGIIYFFIKDMESGRRMLLSQESVVSNDDEGGRDFLPELKKLGITNLLPFLESAQTIEILWGLDAVNKNVKIYSPDERLFTAACGSAIRSCIGIGEIIAKRILGLTSTQVPKIVVN